MRENSHEMFWHSIRQSDNIRDKCVTTNPTCQDHFVVVLCSQMPNKQKPFDTPMSQNTRCYKYSNNGAGGHHKVKLCPFFFFQDCNKVLIIQKLYIPPNL